MAEGESDSTACGAATADEYDELCEGHHDTDPAAACLAELARDGPVLGFGVGTGRLALALAVLGLVVQGVDAPAAVADEMRAKPGGADLPVTLGEFAAAEVAGDLALVVLAFTTAFALPSQEAQVACFANAARHLRPSGHRLGAGEVLVGRLPCDGANDRDLLAQDVDPSPPSRNGPPAPRRRCGAGAGGGGGKGRPEVRTVFRGAHRIAVRHEGLVP